MHRITRGFRGYLGRPGIGLRGYTGSSGVGFSLKKTYESVAEMMQDTNPGIALGEFVIISTQNQEDPENSQLYMWTGSGWEYINDLSGQQGIKGDRGYTGSQGARGYTGSRGIDGVIGKDGYTGSHGYTGSMGYTGSIGYTGSRGDIGVTGPQGDTGYTGSVGYTGSIGYTGSQGIPGEYSGMGYTGSQGDTGYTGSMGYTGSQGIPGDYAAFGYTGSKGETGYTGSRGFPEIYSSYRTNKDQFDIYTTLTYNRRDGTTYLVSTLSGGVPPLYSTRTENYYDQTGTEIVDTITFSLEYDEDGQLVNQIII